ncbi:MAG: FAD-binding oxidoreductase [Vulcanimicrobiaceae bacterium]
MTPPIVAQRVTPGDAEAVAELLATCDRTGRAVIVEGGRTLDGMGGAPTRADVALCICALDRILTYEPHDLTVAVEAGVTLAALAGQLQRERQFVPLDAPLRKRATVGGTLAAGWLGPRRHRYGRPRDLIIGSRVALADGTLARAGGMVVKNVSGYDMSKLYVGSFGTLAVIVEAHFKTLPLPERRRAILARLPSGSAERAVAHLQALAVPPSATWRVTGFHREVPGDDGDDGRLVVFLESTETLMERATRDLRSVLGRAGVPAATIIDDGAYDSFERVCDALIAPLGERSVTYRELGSPENALPRCTALMALAERRQLIPESITDIMNGDRYLRVSDRDALAFNTKIDAFDDELHTEAPNAIVVAGQTAMRADLAVWGEPPRTLARMQALKDRFDPRHTLNPGRFIGGI